MTNLINANIQTMSSKEIAELTGKEHKQVLRNIRDLIDVLNPQYEQYKEHKDYRGYTGEFLLDKDLSITLVSGYSVKMRYEIIKRWTELERKLIIDVLETYGHTCARTLTKFEYDLYIVDFGDVRKVGISSNVKERISHLEREGGRKALNTVIFTNVGGINAEQIILKHFANDVTIGEYLTTPMKDILLFISITF